MLIIGCGYTGKRLARRLLDEGRDVLGTASSKLKVSALQEAGIPAIKLDLDQKDGPLPDLDQDRILYLAPPPPDSEGDPRLCRLLDHLKDSGRTPRLVYAGTTGVYGDCQGEWVDEDRPLNPGTDRAKRRAEAEDRLQTWAEETGAETIVLRIAGIYGPGRLPIDRLKAGMPVLREDVAPFSNRIHVDDLVGACLAAMERGRPGQAYNVADGAPTTMSHYFTLLAELLETEPPPAIGWQEAEKLLPPGLLSFLRENRRINTEKMRRELAFEPRYADLNLGLKFSLSSSV